MNKNLKYACIIAIAVIALSCGLLAIPGQFYDLIPGMRAGDHTMSGYQFMFNLLPDTFKGFTGVYGIGPSPLGISCIVLMGLALILTLLGKKSSAFPLFGAVFAFIAGLFFLCMQPWGANPMFKAYASNSVVLWVSYVVGALLVLSSAYTVYATVMALKEEKANPKQTYSYLKK